MNAEVFAEWLRRQGHKVYKTDSSFWYDAGPHVLQAFPYHWLITPDISELHSLMLKHGIIALRYSSPPEYFEGKISYHIIQRKCYNLQLLDHQARNGVKCGLRNFRVEQISFNQLAKEGWKLQEDTLARQNRSRCMKQHEWEALCYAARDLSGFEVFAAISESELAGAVIACQIDDYYSLPYAMSHSRFLKNHVNNALFYSVCCELLKRENVNGIFFCVESLDAPPNVDEFKLRMGFELKMVRQNVAIHPFLKPFISPTFYKLNLKLHEHYPENPVFAKVEGLLRFHLEGRQPVRAQNCPKCLKDKLDSYTRNFGLYEHAS